MHANVFYKKKWSLFVVMVFALHCGEHKPHNSSDNYRGETLKAKIAILQTKQAHQLQVGDIVSAAHNGLKINKLIETQDILKNGGDLLALDSKYFALEKILQDDISCYHNTFNYSHMAFDDVYPGPNFSSVYHPKVLQESLRVQKDFGDLYISTTKDNNGEIIPEQVRVARPWSGYWHPFSSDWLYKGSNSPLGKFDRLIAKKGKKSNIAATEAKRYQEYSSDSWEGLCDALSLAAITTVEPTKDLTLEGITFTIADLKALSTFAHAKYPHTQYGISYNGSVDTDGCYQDIKPEAFHNIVVSVLGHQKRPIIIDDMAGVQVWNKPLYRYRWKITQDPDNEYAYLVTSYAWLIKERNKETNILTSSRDTIAPTYTYRLYVDKNNKRKGKYRVIAGQWLGRSYRDHPDTVKVPVLNGNLGSHNDGFNKYVSLYKRLFTN